MSKKLVALFVLAIASFSVVANADTVQVAYSGIGAADTMNVWGGGHNGDAVYAGVLMINKTAGSDIWANGSLGAFCIDLPEWASSSPLIYNVDKTQDGPVTNPLYGAMGTEKAAYLAELWGRFYDSSWVDGSYSDQERYDAEAFAASVWEIVFEDLPSVSGNIWDVTADGSAGDLGFRAENLDWSKANYWLSQLDGSGPKADLKVFTNAGAQDYLVQVPEPATLLMLGLGSMALMKKRKAIA